MMTKKVQKNSAILEAVYETASDLHSCGLLTDQRVVLQKSRLYKKYTIVYTIKNQKKYR